RVTALCCGWLLVTTMVAPAQVVISEFMADNSRTLADQDGDFSDWIELYNASGDTVDLAGWSLTDEAAQPTKWRFPRTLLRPNSYLVVFASEKSRNLEEAELHINFKLSADGE